MSGPKRNPDRLNTIGVVVVGVCGAVLVYVTIVALQAFYVGDTSEIQTMADYGGQDTIARDTRAKQIVNLTKPSTQNPKPAGTPQTYHIPIKHAMDRMLETATTGAACGANDACPEHFECRAKPGSGAKVCVDLAALTPGPGTPDKPFRAATPTIVPEFGRPKPLPTAPPPAATPPAGEGAGSGSAAAPTEPVRTPTGGQGPGGGNPPKQPAGTTGPARGNAP